MINFRNAIAHFTSASLTSHVWILWPLVLMAGAILPLQTALINQAGTTLGARNYGLCISYVGGAIGAILLTLFSDTPAFNTTAVTEVPFFSWFAGILGLIYLAIVTFAIPITGPAVAFSLVVAGQLLISLFLEQFGWLNIPQQTFNWYRMGGMFFVIVGVILIRKT